MYSRDVYILLIHIVEMVVFSFIFSSHSAKEDFKLLSVQYIGIGPLSLFDHCLSSFKAFFILLDTLDRLPLALEKAKRPSLWSSVVLSGIFTANKFCFLLLHIFQARHVLHITLMDICIVFSSGNTCFYEKYYRRYLLTCIDAAFLVCIFQLTMGTVTSILKVMS